MKKVLIYSNMYPSKQKPYAGIFIKNQFDYLSQNDQTKVYSILSLERSFTGKVASIKKYLSFYSKSLFFLFRNRFDIIHLHYFYPLLPIAWLLKKVFGSKTVITVHGTDLYDKMRSSLNRRFYRTLLQNCDYIICVGNALKADFERIMQVPVSEVLCAGIDKEKFYPLQIQKEYDFIYVGSLIKRKGFDIVLQLIEKTLSHNFRWCIVGSGEFEPELEAIVKASGNKITYKKNVVQEDLNVLYNKSRWFFFPSRNEPFGLVATEAIYAGTPIITSASGGLLEQVANGINGYTISDVEDIDGIMELLLKVFHLPESSYNEMADNCRTANLQFSLQYVCNRLISLYESL